MNESGVHTSAWLQTSDDLLIPIRGVCSLGRSSSNHVVLSSAKASRRHALIQQQNEGEFWLVDFGSSNGSQVNARRCVQPVRLRDGDQLRFGDQVVTFHQTVEPADGGPLDETEVTLREIEVARLWLLVADIENFTPMSLALSQDDLARTVGAWVSGCRDVIESHGGLINKYLGDGFLAYWHDEPGTAAKMHETLNGLAIQRTLGGPVYRLAIHTGEVTIGGAPSMGEASLMGPEVNLVFRMEKLGGSQNVPCIVSEAAARELAPFRATTALGSHEVKGFDSQHPFFTVAW